MSDEDDRIREKIGQTFSPDWTRRLGQRAAEAIKTSPAATRAAQYVGGKLVDYAHWTQRDQSDKLPQPVKQPLASAQEKLLQYQGKPRPPTPEEELEAIKEKVRITKEAIERAKAAKMEPVDAGEIDEPATRQPVQMSREFPSTPQGQSDREMYIREALKRARQ